MSQRILLELENIARLNNVTSHELKYIYSKSKAYELCSDYKFRISALHGTIASNKNAPAELLLHLAKSPYWHVRCVVATNKNSTEEIFKILHKDLINLVRDGVARNENTPEKYLKLLSKDKDIQVIYTAICNANTHRHDVIEASYRMAKHHDESINAQIAECHNAPQEVLIYLSKHTSTKVKRAVAANPNTPESILLYLADEGWDISHNKNATENCLEHLANTTNSLIVRINILHHKNTSKELSRKIQSREKLKTLLL